MFAERIFRHLTILETHGRNAFEYPHQFFRGVRIELILDFQVSLKIHHKIAIHLAKQNVIFPHLDFYELFKPSIGQIIFIKGGLSEVDADKFFLSVVEFLEHGQQRIIFDIRAEKRITQHRGSHDLVSFR